MTIYLASASPRRKALLLQIGIDVEQFAVDIDETPRREESPLQYVQRMAVEKAEAALLQLKSNNIVITADTIGDLDGKTLVKPIDESDGKAMLKSLSGRVHRIHTAVAVSRGRNILQKTVSTDVYFRPLSKQDIDQYWCTGEPLDKAGAYGIQGIGAKFVARIEGSYSAVVGLPLMETEQMLREIKGQTL